MTSRLTELDDSNSLEKGSVYVHTFSVDCAVAVFFKSLISIRIILIHVEIKSIVVITFQYNYLKMIKYIFMFQNCDTNIIFNVFDCSRSTKYRMLYAGLNCIDFI